MYRIRSSGAVKSQGEIRKLHPNVSLPRVWTSDICDLLGVDPVLNAPQPTASDLEIIFQDGVVQDANGNWVQNWVTKPKFSDFTKQVPELNANGDPVLDTEGNQVFTEVLVTREEQEQKFLQDKQDAKAKEVREERSKLLTASDWTQLDDTPLDNATKLHWAVYRQQLRSIPEQEGFPFTVVWPEKP